MLLITGVQTWSRVSLVGKEATLWSGHLTGTKKPHWNALFCYWLAPYLWWIQPNWCFKCFHSPLQNVHTKIPLALFQLDTNQYVTCRITGEPRGRASGQRNVRLFHMIVHVNLIMAALCCQWHFSPPTGEKSLGLLVPLNTSASDWRCYSLLPEQLQVAFLHKTCVTLTYLTGEGARLGLALENQNCDHFSTQLSLRGTWVLRACCLCWVLSAGEHWGCSLSSVVRTVSHCEGSRYSFPSSWTKSLL